MREYLPGFTFATFLLAIMHIVANGAELDLAPQADYALKYCMQFDQLAEQSIGQMIKEMEKTPYSPDSYFTARQCELRTYSADVKGTIAQIAADFPTSKEESLKNVWLYYAKKRKQPEIFTEALNATNTLGETFLDYIETMYEKGNYTETIQFETIARLQSFACARGAVYRKRINMRCK